MRPYTKIWRRFLVAATLIGVVGLASYSLAAPDNFRVKELKAQADFYEKNAEWEEACKIYEAILHMDRGQKDIKDRYQHCLRRLSQANRHRDISFRKEVLSLEAGDALRLYGVIVETILKNSLDNKKADATKVFRKGLEELRLGLSDPTFIHANLPNVKPADLKAFRDYLAKTWGSKVIKNRPDAVKQVKEIALAAYHKLQLDSTAVVFEFTCGAFYVVDDYSSYLTPTQFREIYAAIQEGEFVGVGLTLAYIDNQLVIADIAPESPAADVMPLLKRNDRIFSIDKKETANLAPETALDLLKGPNGSMVELGIESPLGMRMVINLRRRPVFVPSVSWEILNGGVGLIRIASFQKRTSRDLDKALLAITKAGAKSLIIDLRGNPGGLFLPAIETAKHFLSSGVITSTQNSDASFNTIYQSRNPDALQLPLVVLIDGSTASAAEVLAGALKENNRAQLVGQTTYGKGCIQIVDELPSGPGNLPTGGLRITVTRFFSPTGQPYTGRGVVPHFLVDRFMNEMDDVDRQMQKALELVQK